jgi:hypothetical protein
VNPALRRALGPLHAPLIRLKTSAPLQWAKVSLGYRPWRRERARAGDRLMVDVNARIGMGAILSYALRLHAYAEDLGLEPWIVSSSPLYAARPGEDFLGRHFLRPPAPADFAPLSAPASDWLYHRELPAGMGLDRASALFARWFRPGPQLRETVEQASGGVAMFDLSVHFRGNEKFLESGPIAHEQMLRALAPHLPGGGRGKAVFLATDEPVFRAAVLRRFPEARFTSFDLGDVPEGVPRQYSQLGPDEKAIEALANILLLGRAPLCIRTASYLSALARVANPALRTLTINWAGVRSLGFPDIELRAEEGWPAPG